MIALLFLLGHFTLSTFEPVSGWLWLAYWTAGLVWLWWCVYRVMERASK